MATKKKNKPNNNNTALSPERLIRERMRTLEIGRCYCTDTDEFMDTGEGVVVVTRMHTGGRMSYCCYLVDTYCLGLKDVFWAVRADESDLHDHLEHLGDDIRPCDYEEAHNWVYGAIAWAEEAGISPCKKWALAQFFLEEDTDDVPLVDLPFGRDGQHFLVAESQAELNRYLPILKANLGDNFKYAVNVGDDDFYYDPDDEYEEYEEIDDDDEIDESTTAIYTP